MTVLKSRRLFMVKFFLALLLFSSLLFSAVNVNKANSAQLQTLNGIGPTKAQEIINYRKSHGSFKSVDELVNVKGIGPKTLQKMKSQVAIR
ncbi:MAG: helix-hairpin-helix domain-containing protein [Sulfuricurvum sp.]|nr:helix-hairpin-helix domain-containing protein [Sulfuricurvum sp.]